VLKAGQIVAADALQAHVRARLAGYKVPRLIRFYTALPLTASGKIERQRVRDWLEQAADNAAGA
jgi:acyl-coenzyme A synthetase/AMP-(fatty) acid ligase